jgi:GTP-binding protein EngB required for normal cell division
MAWLAPVYLAGGIIGAAKGQGGDAWIPGNALGNVLGNMFGGPQVVRDDAEINRLKTEIAQLNASMASAVAEAKAAKNPKQAAQAIKNAKKGVYDLISTNPLPKQAKKALVVIGPTCAGKSTLLNAMYGLQLPTSAMRCTKGVNHVGSANGFEIYDVFGTNPDELYVQWEAVEGITTKHVALICFADAVENALDAIDLAKAGGLVVVLVRTKIDSIIESAGETKEQIFAKEAALAKEKGADFYFPANALMDPASLKPLVDFLNNSVA